MEYFQDKGYGVIAPDTLGHGQTDLPTDVNDYKVKTITDSIMEVVDKIAGSDTKITESAMIGKNTSRV